MQTDCRCYPPTSSGSQLAHSAQERMIRRKPTARTKLSKMIAGKVAAQSVFCGTYGMPSLSRQYSLLIPAAILVASVLSKSSNSLLPGGQCMHPRNTPAPRRVATPDTGRVESHAESRDRLTRTPTLTGCARVSSGTGPVSPKMPFCPLYRRRGAAHGSSSVYEYGQGSWRNAQCHRCTRLTDGDFDDDDNNDLMTQQPSSS